MEIHVGISAVSAPPAVALIPSPELLFGLMLAAALIGGYLARAVRVPRVVGFLLAGVVLHVALGALAGGGEDGESARALRAAAEPLTAIKDLALGLILFTIGGVFERSRLRSAGASILRISAFETALTAIMVFSGCTLFAVVTQREYGAGENIALCVLLAMAAIATAPAATLFVLQEYEAKGSITDTILGLTGVNNVVCIVLFHVTFLILTAFGVIQSSAPVAHHVVAALATTVFGSVGLGLLCGTLLSILHAKLPVGETVVVFFAMFLLLGSGEKWLIDAYGLAYNFLLTAVVTGAVFANVGVDPQKLTDALRSVGAPILAGFFVIAGYGLHISDLADMGWIGGMYVLCRFFGKSVGCKLGLAWAKAPVGVDGRLGSALLCQAAVVIGLASFVERNWDSELARRFSTVVLGSVVLFEMIGPLFVKRCVVYGGEVKAISLLRRVGSATEGASIVRMTLQSLVRLFRPVATASRGATEPASVKHVMRTNVQLIPAAAAFDEVLHLIERSTYSHFPVVTEDGDFAGVIHFSDIRNMIYDPTVRDLVTAVDLADADAAIAPMDMPLTEALDVLTAADVGVIAVVEHRDSRRVVGVAELRDVLKALHVVQKSARIGN